MKHIARTHLPHILAVSILGALPAQASDVIAIPIIAAVTVVSNPITPWMSQDVSAAWKSGYKGQGATIIVVDDFTSASKFSGKLTNVLQTQRHGEWTRLEASLIAPSAAIVSDDFNTANTVALASRGLNVINLSYGMYVPKAYAASKIGWSAQEASIIDYATKGRAVIAKAAGNDAIPIGSANAKGQVDVLNTALTGKATAIFVGALNKNGSPTDKASLASYSNSAGSNAAVQAKFLVAGVRGDLTALYGTSFAAPIISGYAAVLGSKFTNATPTAITNQLLATARQDTLSGYNAAVYGRGEASLSRALAPVAIK